MCVCLQLKNLTKTVKDLVEENVRLKQTIKELLKGGHDITLKGESQKDMEWLMGKCAEDKKKLDFQCG